jgi:hypothetical protein
MNMVEQEVIRGECSHFRLLSELNIDGTCTNCICLQSQLNKVHEEVKSLRTIFFLLQKEHGLSYADQAQLEQGKTDPPEIFQTQMEAKYSVWSVIRDITKSIIIPRNGKVQNT